MLTDLGLAGFSPESREPDSVTENSAAPTMAAPMPPSSRYWRRLTAADDSGEDLLIGRPFAHDEEVCGTAEFEAGRLDAHGDQAGLEEILLGERKSRVGQV